MANGEWITAALVLRDEPILRAKAKEAIHSGILPASQPDRTTWNGSGSGTDCVLCSKPVRANQIELDISFERPEPRHQYSFHARCFSAWEYECTEFSRARQHHPLPASVSRSQVVSVSTPRRAVQRESTGARAAQK